MRMNELLTENYLLLESYKDATRKFKEEANDKEVKEYIDTFKELAKRNILKGQEKDISQHIKGGWELFKDFIDNKKTIKSGTQKRKQVKKDSIIVYEDDDKMVVIPLTKESSILYGKGTKWCTSGTENNLFANYYYATGVVLFYVIMPSGKYAAAMNTNKQLFGQLECFDIRDNSLTTGEFTMYTGITKKQINQWYTENKNLIEDTRDINKMPITQQIALVTDSPRIIKNIDNPSEELQLLAVRHSGWSIQYIKNPSEELQLVAIEHDPMVIKYIDSPSEEVQLIAVKHNGVSIKYVDNPSEEVQLIAVKVYAHAIGIIIDKGIIPSEEVQLASVKRSGESIQYIDNPSEEVQLEAVKRSGISIRYINTPSEKVQALHDKLWR